MNITRKMKLNSLGYYNFTESEQELIDFIKDNLLNLTEVKLQKYPNFIFWFKDNKLIFLEYSFEENILISINTNFYYFFVLYLYKYRINIETYTYIRNVLCNIFKYKNILKLNILPDYDKKDIEREL